jgi:hypothetical protein
VFFSVYLPHSLARQTNHAFESTASDGIVAHQNGCSQECRQSCQLEVKTNSHVTARFKILKESITWSERKLFPSFRKYSLFLEQLLTGMVPHMNVQLLMEWLHTQMVIHRK